VALLLLTFFALCLGSVWRKTLTTDEPFHYRYGMDVLRLHADRFDNSKMPLSALNALPCRLGECFGGAFPDQGTGLGRLLCHRTTARLMTTLVALLLALYVYRWSRALYGPAGGLLSLSLFAFDPNLIAHSRLVTTDLFVTALATIAGYHFWRFLEHGGRRAAAASALTLGAAQLAKYTAAYLYPIFLLIAGARRGGEWIRALRRRDGAFLRRLVGRAGTHLVAFALASLLVINVGFLFTRTFTRLDGYHFRSRPFVHLQQWLEPVGFLPVPVPYPYLEGLDWVKATEDDGTTNANLYLLGRLHDRQDPDRAFPGYFLVAWLFKVPLATQALVLWALFLLARRFRLAPFLRAELHLLLPVAFFTVYFNFFFKTEIGFRFFLVVVPFLLVLCGRLLAPEGGVGRRGRRVVGVLLGALVSSVLLQFPHYISYMNELVPDRTMSYRVLADSNLEWGQDRGYMKEYMSRHPEAILHPRRPMAGRLVISVNQFVGVTRRPVYVWLRRHFQPVDHIAGSYLIFDVSEEALERALSDPPPSPASVSDPSS